MDVVRAIYEDRHQQVWVAGLRGVVKWSGDGFTAVVGTQELDGHIVNVMLKDRNDSLWLAGSKGIIRMNPDGSLRRFDSRDGLPDSLVRAFWEDRRREPVGRHQRRPEPF